MSRILVGTCSWADHTNFYPPDLPANQQITFYSERFPVVEINSTFYRLMPARNFALWAQRTPEGFVFDVKPTKQLTWHDRENPPDETAARAFSASIQPLREAGKLGAIHAQFPPWFVYRPENIVFFRQLREWFPHDRLGVEFRHRSWFEGEALAATCESLRAQRIGLTVVDEPQIGSGSAPTALEVTNPELAIVRFHGRNAKMWYAKTKTTAERFDYLYSESELAEWVPKARQLAERAAELHLLFNNNAQDYAVRNAQQLRMMLDAE